jgi:threonine/homoserine/homoserine lactone efflux protein
MQIPEALTSLDGGMEWLHHVGFLEMVIVGTIIGIVASAPMGPVGILCVQRTLNKGRWAGFATGAGAAVSDIIYALITGYGMSMVVSIVENPKITFWIQLIGSILLFLFGLYTFRTDPAAKTKNKPEVQAKQVGRKYKNAKKQRDSIVPESPRTARLTRGAWMNNFMTGFLVTFSNPLIIFLFVALFGQFTFIRPFNPGPQIIGYLFIVVGALAWWFLLTWLIEKVRTRFDSRGIRMINCVIGAVVMTVSAIMAMCTIF